MDAAKSVTAHFKPDVTLTRAKQGVGDVNPDVGVHTYIRDHVASVSNGGRTRAGCFWRAEWFSVAPPI